MKRAPLLPLVFLVLLLPATARAQILGQGSEAWTDLQAALPTQVVPVAAGLPEAPSMVLSAGAVARAVAFSPDGRLLAVGNDAGKVLLLEVPSFSLRHTLDGVDRRLLASERVKALAFSSDSRSLAVGGDSRKVRIVDVASGAVTLELDIDVHAISGLAFSPDGAALALQTGDEVRLYDLAAARRHAARGVMRRIGDSLNPFSRPPYRRLTWAAGAESDLLFTPDGSRLLSSADGKNAVRLVDIASGEDLVLLLGHGDPARQLAVTPDGRMVVSGGLDSTLRVWDLATQRAELVVRFEAPLRDVALDGAGRLLAAAGADGSLYLRDLPGATILGHVVAHEGQALAVALSPDGALMASTGEDAEVQIRRLR